MCIAVAFVWIFVGGKSASVTVQERCNKKNSAKFEMLTEDEEVGRW